MGVNKLYESFCIQSTRQQIAFENSDYDRVMRMSRKKKRKRVFEEHRVDPLGTLKTVFIYIQVKFYAYIHTPLHVDTNAYRYILQSFYYRAMSTRLKKRNGKNVGYFYRQGAVKKDTIRNNVINSSFLYKQTGATMMVLSTSTCATNIAKYQWSFIFFSSGLLRSSVKIIYPRL